MSAEAMRRGEAVLALLRRLRRRPVLPHPSGEESDAELRSRIDAPGQAAALTDEQYSSLLRSERVAWKSVLAFVTQEADGSATRAFWIDPLRLTCSGCLLDEADIETLAPFFGLPGRSSARREGAPPAQVTNVGELECGTRFLLPDGRQGEVDERYAADLGCVAVRLDPDSEHPSRLLIMPETPVYPLADVPERFSARANRRRGKLRLLSLQPGETKTE
jgi:hypothetical protein